MDSLPISGICFSLISTITKTSHIIIEFVKDVRAAWNDLDSVSRELLSLKIVLELLSHDVTNSANNFFPQTLQKQIVGIVKNCTEVVLDIEETLSKHEGGKSNKEMQWATFGKSNISKLRSSLEAHKSALEIALDMVTLTKARNTKTNIQQNLDDPPVGKEETTQILAEIARLQDKLPRDLGQGNNISKLTLERELDSPTDSAGAIYIPLIDENDNSKGNGEGSTNQQNIGNGSDPTAIGDEFAVPKTNHTSQLIHHEGIEMFNDLLDLDNDDRRITADTEFCDEPHQALRNKGTRPLSFPTLLRQQQPQRPRDGHSNHDMPSANLNLESRTLNKAGSVATRGSQQSKLDTSLDSNQFAFGPIYVKQGNNQVTQRRNTTPSTIGMAQGNHQFSLSPRNSKPEIVLVVEGVLGHRISGFLEKMYGFNKRFFWFGSNPNKPKFFRDYFRDVGYHEVSIRRVAWSSYTGRGILYSSPGSSQGSPTWIVNLSEVIELTAEGSLIISFRSSKISPNVNKLKASTRPERDSWLANLMMKIQEAKDLAPTVYASDEYKKTYRLLTEMAAGAAVEVAAEAAAKS